MSQSNMPENWTRVITSEVPLHQTVQRGQSGDHHLSVWGDINGEACRGQKRCPRRDIQLSSSFVRSDRLKRLYDSWSHDWQGSRAAILARSKLTLLKSITVAACDCVERTVFIWASSRGSADPFPEIDAEWRAGPLDQDRCLTYRYRRRDPLLTRRSAG